MALVTLDPTGGKVAVSGFRLTARPPTLEDQVLGVVANGLHESEIMFDALAELLTETDGLGGVVKIVKGSVGVAPDAAQWATVTEQATVAVTGFGGCGSCSTRSMRDALDLEGVGIPAVLLVHETLVPAVNAMVQLLEATDQPMAVVRYPHNPSGYWTKDEAREIAATLAPFVRQGLTG